MTALELLAPARNAQIGIAAIDCGADAVYIAGPAFGARKDAGNPVQEIKTLCDYAHRYGAKIFVTVNTILTDSQLDDCYALMLSLKEAGADALIVQDPAILQLAKGGPDGKGARIDIPLHASTQCAIRTPEKAAALEKAGFSRLVLERQLSLPLVKAIRRAVEGEIEFFVHGALCVSYSGQCYLSQKLCGRSANRGECIQACRARYDLTDSAGNVLARNKALLSLKDLNLIERLEDLAEAGVCSFKIEGRLKNLSYVKNTVSAYSRALDALVAKAPDKYCRASAGRVASSFEPDLDKTFNRGYTSLFLDGKRGLWAAQDTPKSMGQKLGKVLSVKALAGGMSEIKVDTTAALSNGDGFAFVYGDAICGVRGDICRGNTIMCKSVAGLRPGVTLYRNISAAFEKEIDSAACRRIIDVELKVGIVREEEGRFIVRLNAVTSDGRKARIEERVDAPTAQKAERMKEIILGSLSKSAEHYSFAASFVGNSPEALPLLSAAALNELRRRAAALLNEQPCLGAPLRKNTIPQEILLGQGEATYKDNVANSISAKLYGGVSVSSYETTHYEKVELMRSRYCIRRELGLCPKQSSGKGGVAENLYLTGNGKPLELQFHCDVCEMAVVG